MSLPKRLYNLYKEVCNCKLVSGEITAETLTDFQNLVNSAQSTSPDADANEVQQQEFTRSLYHSNPVGFYNYVANTRNRVSALVLWTESKRIVDFFGLRKRVHLSWNPETKLYTASEHIPRQTGSQSTGQSTTQTTQVDQTGSRPDDRSDNQAGHRSDSRSFQRPRPYKQGRARFQNRTPQANQISQTNQS